MALTPQNPAFNPFNDYEDEEFKISSSPQQIKPLFVGAKKAALKAGAWIPPVDGVLIHPFPPVPQEGELIDNKIHPSDIFPYIATFFKSEFRYQSFVIPRKIKALWGNDKPGKTYTEHRIVVKDDASLNTNSTEEYLKNWLLLETKIRRMAEKDADALYNIHGIAGKLFVSYHLDFINMHIETKGSFYVDIAELVRPKVFINGPNKVDVANMVKKEVKE